MAVVAAGIHDVAGIDAHFAEAKRLNLGENTLADTRVVANALAGRGDSARAALTDYVRLNPGPAGAPPSENIHRMTGLTLLAEGKPQEAIAELQQGGANPYAQLGIIEALIKLGRTTEAEAQRTAMLGRKDTAWGSTSIPIARYRALNRRS
jgi:hypothetical protein